MKRLIALFGLTVLAISPACANFDITATVTNGSASGSAEFVYNGGNSMTVYLENLSNMKNGAISQILTGVTFSTANGTGFVGGPNGAVIDVSNTGGAHDGWDCSASGCVVQTATQTSNSINTAGGSTSLINNNIWTGASTGTGSGAVYTLDMLNMGPDFGIVNDTITCSATNTNCGNGSLSNAVHNPYILATTFTLPVSSDPGNITSASLNFGTILSPVAATLTPEPAFYGIMSFGLAGLWLVRRRRNAA
jgi:hypothetical protein